MGSEYGVGIWRGVGGEVLLFSVPQQNSAQSAAQLGGLLDGFEVAGSRQDFTALSGIRCLTLREEKIRRIQRWGRARSSMGGLGPWKMRQRKSLSGDSRRA